MRDRRDREDLKGLKDAGVYLPPLLHPSLPTCRQPCSSSFLGALDGRVAQSLALVHARVVGAGEGRLDLREGGKEGKGEGGNEGGSGREGVDGGRGMRGQRGHTSGSL